MKTTLFLYFAIFSSFLANGQEINSFNLPNTTNNTTFELSSLSNNQAIILIFHSNKCAYSEYYLKRIKNIQSKFAGQKVAVVLINSNSSELVEEESIQAMATYASQNLMGIPYLADKKRTVKNSLRATRTPEAFVLEPVQGQFKVVYHGAIDDSPQVEGDIGHAYLEDAVVNLLNKTKPTVKDTRPVGCLIK